MADSIKNELEQLETVGRVSARGQRPVHAEFGFAEMKRDDSRETEEPPAGNVAASLDDAFSRLKARVEPE
ncbi:MAG: hypothetical protein QM648_08425 [Solirubrobacterales bacterium]